MTSLIETLPPPARTFSRQEVLSDNRLHASVLHLEAGELIDLPPDRRTDERVLFVIDGRATVHVSDLNHVLNREQALHLAGAQTVSIWNHGSEPAKLLQLNLTLLPREETLVTLNRP